MGGIAQLGILDRPDPAVGRGGGDRTRSPRPGGAARPLRGMRARAAEFRAGRRGIAVI